GLLRLRDALLGDLAERRRDFHLRNLEIRELEFRHFERGWRELGFGLRGIDRLCRERGPLGAMIRLRTDLRPRPIRAWLTTGPWPPPRRGMPQPMLMAGHIAMV